MADLADVERVRAEHLLLRQMAPDDRAIALLSAICDAENDTFGQVLSLLDALTCMSKFLDRDEREFVAHKMVDSAVLKLVLRWN